MKKQSLILFLLSGSSLYGITSNTNYRITSTNPLFFTFVDHQAKKSGYEIAPFFSSMYHAQQANQNLILKSKNTITLDQGGFGDFNPSWINLVGNTQEAYYHSDVTFKPHVSQGGMLFHGYAESDSLYCDIKTAILETKSKITISEVGGNNGLNDGISNAEEAFSQSDWNFGKIGQSNQVIGLDNIQIEVGTTKKFLQAKNTFVSFFGLVEAPTGTGSQAEWLLEAKVGTNHWGLGFGTQTNSQLPDGLQIFTGMNYRYIFGAYETRSFDLLNNGEWSRYLGLQDTYGLPNSPDAYPLPGINFLTQQAHILGRSQLNIYGSIEKKFGNAGKFTLGYNLFYSEQEQIDEIAQLTPGFGVYALTGSSGGAGGSATASHAQIYEASPTQDALLYPVAITVDQFDKRSACAGTMISHRFSTSLERVTDTYSYGFGANIDPALLSDGISTWAVWGKFEYFFGKNNNDDIMHDQESFEYLDDEFSHLDEDIIKVLQTKTEPLKVPTSPVEKPKISPASQNIISSQATSATLSLEHHKENMIPISQGLALVKPDENITNIQVTDADKEVIIQQLQGFTLQKKQYTKPTPIIDEAGDQVVIQSINGVPMAKKEVKIQSIEQQPSIKKKIETVQAQPLQNVEVAIQSIKTVKAQKL
jgi:hypothetical protein